MNPARLAIKYKQLTFVTLLILLSAGIFSYINMPRQEDPDVNPPVAQIEVVFPGASALQVEQLVTGVLERELSEISEISRTTSSSSNSYASIIMELEHHIDADAVWQEVQEKLNQAKEKLPTEAREPQLNTELVKTVTSVISVSGQDIALLTQVAQGLEAELLKLPPVAKVEVVGQQKQEVLIAVDDQKLYHYQLTLEQLINTVKINNLNIPGTSLDLGVHQAVLGAPNQLQSPADLADLVVGLSPQGWPLKVADVAQVSWANREEEFFIRSNGQPAVILEVTMKDRENVVTLGKLINQVLAEARAAAPHDVQISLIADQPGDVAARLGTFSGTLLFGMVLVVLTVFLAMGWRNALVVSLTIPFSVTLAFAGMGLWQISLHQVSIAALVIALGILVDNAIVINDNIYRHWQQGKPLLDSCGQGLKEVAIPVFSSTLTTIAAFIPLMLMPGDVGEFIKAIPQVVSLTLLSSLIIATTVAPLTFYLLMRRRTSPNLANVDTSNTSASPDTLVTPRMNILSDCYLRLLRRALAHPILTMTIALAFLGGSLLLVSRLGVEFFPPSEKNMVLVQVAAPAGTVLAETDALVREVEAFLADQPQVVDFTSYVGKGVPKFYYNVFPISKAGNQSQIMVNLDPGIGIQTNDHALSIGYLASDWQNRLQNQLGNARIRVDLLEQGPPVGAPVAFRITGPELEILAHLADQAVTLLRTIPGTTAINHGLAEQELSIDAQVSLDRAAMSGVTRLDVANTLRYVNKRQEITTIKSDIEEIPVMLTITGQATTDVGLESLWVTSAQTGHKAPLGQVASLIPSWQWSNISHWENNRTVFVYSYVESNYSADEIFNQVIPLLASLELPPGYYLEIGGQMEDQIISFGNLAQAGITAVLLIYFILIFQFNSLIQPLLIVLSIPFTLVGAAVGLYFLGYPIGFMAFLGLVSLVGIVVNNAIVLVDFINCRRREGMELTEAIITAGKQRLRPILLTTATTIGGLLPLSVTGGNLWGPMGFAIIFGLLGSTLLTLVILPTLYHVIFHNQQKRAKTL